MSQFHRIYEEAKAQAQREADRTGEVCVVYYSYDDERATSNIPVVFVRYKTDPPPNGGVWFGEANPKEREPVTFGSVGVGTVFRRMGVPRTIYIKRDVFFMNGSGKCNAELVEAADGSFPLTPLPIPTMFLDDQLIVCCY